MPKSVTVTLEALVLEALDRTAEQRGRTRADIIAEAVRDYFETRRWQIAKIEAGIATADWSEFVSEDEIKPVLGKYGISERGLSGFLAVGHHANRNC